jgi:EF-P beta-lysylation protein EpmB
MIELVDGYLTVMPIESPILPASGHSVRATSPGRIGLQPVREDITPPFETWQEAIKHAIRDSQRLCSILSLDKDLASESAATSFPVFAPWEFISRMKPGDPADPLLRQVLATAEEDHNPAGFTDDPVGDDVASLSPGLIRKYRSRSLLITTGACAIHCRYCFRRHFPYSTSPKSADDWQPALDQIAQAREIDEVILSGGDPLMLVDDTLAELAERISRIDHVQRLRIHTRLPIVIPQRVTSELLAWLRGTRLAAIMVVHANHPNEIDQPTAEALVRLVDAGVPVLNQSVLLRGVNDDVAALVELSRKLVNLRVMPYYLHQLDRVRGAAHFEVPVARGLELIEAMRKQLPGYAVPRFVQEVAGKDSKSILA